MSQALCPSTDLHAASVNPVLRGRLAPRLGQLSPALCFLLVRCLQREGGFQVSVKQRACDSLAASLAASRTRDTQLNPDVRLSRTRFWYNLTGVTRGTLCFYLLDRVA